MDHTTHPQYLVNFRQKSATFINDAPAVTPDTSYPTDAGTVTRKPAPILYLDRLVKDQPGFTKRVLLTVDRAHKPLRDMDTESMRAALWANDPNGSYDYWDDDESRPIDHNGLIEIIDQIEENHGEPLDTAFRAPFLPDQSGYGVLLCLIMEHGSETKARAALEAAGIRIEATYPQ